MRGTSFKERTYDQATDRTRPWPCLYCDHVSDGEAESQRHRETHPMDERIATCATCGKVYVNQGPAYLRHVARHAPLDPRRFFANVHMTSECWLWTGCLDTKGYGQIMFQRVRQSVHRVSYENMVGPIPEGMEIDHVCRVRNCVRPEHLEVVTHDENMRRAWEYHGQRLKACPFCSFTTISPSSIKVHVMRKHPGRADADTSEGES